MQDVGACIQSVQFFLNAVRDVGTCTQPACQILSVVAMSYVDSEVVFRSRCDEIKLSSETVMALKAKGWSTFGSYAFSISTNPGQISDDDFDSKVSIPILGAANHAEAALLRRLLFESYTLTATELRRKTDTSEADGPKKLPVQEMPHVSRPWSSRSSP